MRITLLLMINFILLISLIHAQEIQLENETITVTPIIKEICNTTQQNVFSIKRENYTTNTSPLTLNYETSCGNISSNHTKTIKKFTTTKTGHCYFENSSTYKLKFNVLNESVNFSIQVDCQENNTINTTVSNLSNQSEIILENISRNLSTQELTIIENESLDCFEKPRININKHVFEKGEQLTFTLETEHTPKEYTIQYWIETPEGSYLKKPRNTTNTQTKKHTFTSIQGNGALVRLDIHDTCGVTALIQSVVFTEQEEKPEQPSIYIDSLEAKTGLINLNILANRGTSDSSIIDIKARSEKGSVLANEKIKINSKNSRVEISSTIPTKDAKIAKITIEGLDISITEEVEIPQEKKKTKIIKAYTKQTHYEDSLNWYVHTSQETPIIIEIISGKNNILLPVLATGETTHNTSIPYQGGNVTTILHHESEKIQLSILPNIEQRIINKTPKSQSNNKTKILIENKPKKESKTISKQHYLISSLSLLTIAGGIYLHRKYKPRYFKKQRNKFIK